MSLTRIDALIARADQLEARTEQLEQIAGVLGLALVAMTVIVMVLTSRLRHLQVARPPAV